MGLGKLLGGVFSGSRITNTHQAIDALVAGRQKQALAWLEQAAVDGDNGAAVALGQIFCEGEFCPKDPAKAVAFASYAAERGYVDAMMMVGGLCTDEDLTCCDIELAQKWYDRAGQAGETLGWVMLGNVWLHGDAGESQDLDRAYHWFDKAAAAGDVDGYFNHAMCLFHGRSMDADVPSAIAKLEELAAQDHVPSLHNLASYHRSGEHVPKDTEKSWELYHRAISAGSTTSMLDLGDMCAHQEAEAAKPEDAMSWYERARDAGDESAWYAIGKAFEHGTTGEPDDLQAAAAYCEGAKAEHDMSKVAFARMYAEGRGVILDRPHAFALWSLVVLQGYDDAAIEEARRGLNEISGKMSKAELEQGAQNIRDWA